MITFNTIDFFENLSQQDLMIALSRLKIQHEFLPKGSVVFSAGQIRDDFAIVISGKVIAEEYGLNEEKILLFVCASQDLLADFGILTRRPWKISYRAITPVEILRLNMQALRAPINQLEQTLLDRLYENMISAGSKLNQKILNVSLPTLRQKILYYLQQNAPEEILPGEYFDIDLDRSGMASYLNTDRSALSKELGKLKQEGIIDFDRNHFCFCSWK